MPLFLMRPATENYKITTRKILGLTKYSRRHDRKMTLDPHYYKSPPLSIESPPLSLLSIEAVTRK